MGKTKEEVSEEVETLWKEIVSEREDKSTNVLTEDGHAEDPEDIAIETGKHPGERNTAFGCPSLRGRAIDGLKALKAYGGDDNGLETDLSDMVSDLFHLAFQAGLDPDEIVRKAHVHFDDEIRGIF